MNQINNLKNYKEKPLEEKEILKEDINIIDKSKE